MKSGTYIFTFLFMMFALGVTHSTYAIADNPPNIVFFLSDDQGIEAIDGSPAWPDVLQTHSPVIANLATQGTVFQYTRVVAYLPFLHMIQPNHSTDSK